MTREEFLALPPSLALALLWDNGFAPRLADAEAPKVPRPPKFDSAIYRKGGFQWASETELESLVYWHDRYAASAMEDSKYADKDAKRAKALSYWIAWRRVLPFAAWSGERNHERVTAALPSYEPELHQTQPRGNADEALQPASQPSFDDGAEDDDIPF